MKIFYPSFPRFIVIVFPMRSRSVCTISNCQKAILVVWIIAALLSLPVVITKVKKSHEKTTQRSKLISHSLVTPVQYASSSFFTDSSYVFNFFNVGRTSPCFPILIVSGGRYCSVQYSFHYQVIKL